ncbi:MAG: ECF transporter S component [Paramuribaculum sp.]|nr:ECF transporter S component [Paramuribaculum sp.]MDE6782642.1 ECF transporter S component [Paramuribaculum sp.]
MQTTLRLQSLPFNQLRTYFMAALFVAGNILLPRIFHLLPLGGPTWLPIYFFTLIGAYLYGWRVGLLTALASPVINSVLFGMPAVAVLPAILIKSVLLASAAGFVAHRFGKASIGLLSLVVLSYQAIGTLGEWALSGDLSVACQDFRIGIPGMLLQIIGGWIIINSQKR